MTNVAAWRWPRIVLLWLAALLAVLALAVVDVLRLRGSFYWLLPYPGTLGGAWRFLIGVWQVVPFAMTGLVVAPLAAAAVTSYWMVVRTRGPAARPSGG